jgi:4-amino-4-deoxy-L-arabinose transferase-like glycosyltransferase
VGAQPLETRRPLGLELVLVALIALAVLAPGITRYSLVDPWETHYGEVARVMRLRHDLVHLDWPGTNASADPDEGFRSKPVLTFWLMAAGMAVTDVASNGGYSGELVSSSRTMAAIRLPMIGCAVIGLVLVWWMLARLVSRRVAWLSVLVIGTTPFFCLIARQGIPDMPLCMTVMGAMALLVMALEDGDRAIEPRARTWVLGAIGGFAFVQAAYAVLYFVRSPWIAIPVFPNPALFLPALIAVLYAGIFPRVWWWISLPLRYVVRALLTPVMRSWPRAGIFADRLLALPPLTTMRQVYLLWCYALLGVSVLAKGPPGVTVVFGVAAFYIALLGRWRDLYDGRFELIRGLLVMLVVFLPWHMAMWLKDGLHFVQEYVFTHILDRATADPDKSLGTFEHYTSQLGHGMWLWAALVPPAIAAALVGARTTTREGRVRFLVALWAISGVAVFCLVTTKFHHYILPAVPALAILVAMLLDDLFAGRARLHPIYAALGVGIVLLVARDLMFEPDRWIEMFIYRYDRPWPSAEPWSIDPSSGFLALGVVAACAVALLAVWRRAGVIAIGGVGLAICVWALQIYMPLAGDSWGMRQAMRRYYEMRTIYGEHVVYYGARELSDDWTGRTTWTIETFIPDGLQVGQPMSLTLEVRKPDDERVTEQTLVLTGAATHIGAHSIEVTVPPAERAKLEPLLARGRASTTRGGPPRRAVDADRLIAWDLYWRGEQFWSGGEIWGELPEQKTTFAFTDDVKMVKYLNDHALAPPGRRYFVITDPGKLTRVRAAIPTTRGKATFEVLDQTSNKFTLAVFEL